MVLNQKITLTSLGMALLLFFSTVVPPAQAQLLREVEYVKAPWSPSIYMIKAGKTTHLSYDQWKNFGKPRPTMVYHIPGSTYVKSCQDIYAFYPGGEARKLNVDELQKVGNPVPLDGGCTTTKAGWLPDFYTLLKNILKDCLCGT